MALKFKINQAGYDKLSDALKTEYVAGEADGEFVLDVSDLPKGEDVGPIKRALESERTKSKDFKAKLDEANEKISSFPDVEALKVEHAKEVGKFKAFTEDTLINGKAFELASKISTMPKLLAKEIKERLVVDLSGDVPVAKIKGSDGKVDDKLTFDTLGNEFLANKDFAGIMIGSKASGGGAPRVPIKPSGGGAPAGEQGDKPVNLANLKGPELRAHLDAQRAERQEAEA